jgi:EAL domain-containing protein (putative c-di-GMP-specific phosphodiesterase class I)
MQAQADLLAHLGCHAYQGYLFSRPLPVAAFEALLRQAQERGVQYASSL